MKMSIMVLTSISLACSQKVYEGSKDFTIPEGEKQTSSENYNFSLNNNKWSYPSHVIDYSDNASNYCDTFNGWSAPSKKDLIELSDAIQRIPNFIESNKLEGYYWYFEELTTGENVLDRYGNRMFSRPKGYQIVKGGLFSRKARGLYKEHSCYDGGCVVMCVQHPKLEQKKQKPQDIWDIAELIPYPEFEKNNKNTFILKGSKWQIKRGRKMSYNSAESYCEKQGMRIPNKNELANLYNSLSSYKHEPRKNGENEGSKIQGMEDGWYWTNTPSTTSAFMTIINFSDGSTDSGYVVYSEYNSDSFHYVRCVRD